MAHKPYIDIDIVDNWGETPLMLAVRAGNA